MDKKRSAEEAGVFEESKDPKKQKIDDVVVK